MPGRPGCWRWTSGRATRLLGEGGLGDSLSQRGGEQEVGKESRASPEHRSRGGTCACVGGLFGVAQVA